MLESETNPMSALPAGTLTSIVAFPLWRRFL